MTDVECESCGSTFDADREMDGVFYDPRRCPHCGTKADVEEDGEEAPAPAPDGVDTGTEEEIVALAGSRVRITIEIEPVDG